MEPELRPPTPGYGGYPLEALPPVKLKRPSSVPKGSKKSKFVRELPAPEELAEREEKYRRQLATSRLEELTSSSEERGNLKLRIPARRAQTPEQQEIPHKQEKTPKKIRLKVSLPKPKQEQEEDPDNDDFCLACGGTGVFICCELCPRLFHLLCCDPPLEEVPEDNWNCNECRLAMGLEEKRLWNHIGMFGPLMNSLQGRNPAEFRLPKKLRDGTFLDVATGLDYEYTDSHMKPDLAYTKVNGLQLAGYNKNEDLDIDSLYDKDGKPRLCHKCKLLGLNKKTLVACDYCPLLWHLDCLPEPVCVAKTIGQKWRCPNHIENLRQFRDTAVLDLALVLNFLEVSSNFLIKHSDQPYLTDDSAPQLAEYLQYEKNDFISNQTDYRETESTPPQDEFRVPEFLQTSFDGNKVVSRSSRKLAKVLLMTNADDPYQRPFVYRVPEQLLVLDFLAKQHQKNKKQAVLEEIEQYEQKQKQETAAENDTAAALQHLHDRQPLDFYELVAAAGVQAHRDNIEQNELNELRQIKTLMEHKGKDALLRFLQS